MRLVGDKKGAGPAGPVTFMLGMERRANVIFLTEVATGPP
jgi:hypothetical protein